MPIFYQQDIDESTKLAVWKIEEDEAFFLQHVPLQRDITHPHKRLQHLAGRYLLQYLFPDFPISLIKIADTRKPYLEDEAYHFSISHCSDYAAAIVSRNKRVGVDIEVPTVKVERIMHKFLHPTEAASLQLRVVDEGSSYSLQTASAKGEDLQQHDNPKPQTPNPKLLIPNFKPLNPKLTLLWSCKEAVFKWWSYGQVDFSEMIRLEPFDMQERGVIGGRFVSEEKTYGLSLNYHLFEGICLAWVAE